ncbi:MAG: hypothetical protein ACTJLM_00265 [Ehrlichia sp.]
MPEKSQEKFSDFAAQVPKNLRTFGFALVSSAGLAVCVLSATVLVVQKLSMLFPNAFSFPSISTGQALVSLIGTLAGALIFGAMVTNNSLITSAEDLKGGLAGRLGNTDIESLDKSPKSKS